MSELSPMQVVFLVIASVALVFIAVFIAYMVTYEETENSDSRVFVGSGDETNLEEFEEHIESFGNDPSKLLLELSNCYYNIYDSNLLRRNESFNIKKEVEKHVLEFQEFVPTALWIDYYAEQCSAINR